MAQAKGILPRRDDREVLYKNPRTAGYFIGVRLDAEIDCERARAWLSLVSGLIDQLVAREPAARGGEKGEKVAAVAVGLAPGFFARNGQPRFDPPIEPPTCFATDAPLPNAAGPLAGVPLLDADVLFYVASVYEARVNEFASRLAQTTPDVQTLTLDRGYQRLDETEPFGYRDGVRNVVPKDERAEVVFVHRDGKEPDEPAWADAGSYMAFLKILQRPDQFAALPDDNARDAIIGRRKDGTRLDTDQGADPAKEPAEPPPNLPPTSHVFKAGPRGAHDDTQIFRRGLPFMEGSPDGQLRVGLNFCSFQASLDQFDVVFNDWMVNPSFPPQADGGQPGTDALLDPARELTAVEKVGFFFVPPHHENGLAAAVFSAPPQRRQSETGRLVVRKRVVDPSDPTRRFERRGFEFRVLDSQGQLVAGSEFTTDSTGRGVCPAELRRDDTYTLEEVVSPVANVQLQQTPFTVEKRVQQLRVVNQVTQPNTPYGV